MFPFEFCVRNRITLFRVSVISFLSTNRRSTRPTTNVIEFRDIVIADGEDVQLVQGVHVLEARDAIVVEREVGEIGQRVQTFDDLYVVERQVYGAGAERGRGRGRGKGRLTNIRY